MKNYTFLIVICLLFFNMLPVQSQPANDNIANAEVIPHSPVWDSYPAGYTTVWATPDGIAGSCWNAGPSFNVWFTFQAVYPEMILTLDRGDALGTIRQVNMAAWEADGVTEIACNRYVDAEDDVTLTISNLTIGNWYYVSVDNFGAGHRGTFSLTQRHFDNYAGALEVPHIATWCSPDAAFSNVTATADMNAGSCWNAAPDYNVWFKFQATTTQVQILVDQGGTAGTLRQINAAIWESDGLTEVACNRYSIQEEDIYVAAPSLTIGSWYYISVDNYGVGHRGTFALCVDNVINYDFYEGAITIPHTSDWCSLDAEFTTIGATPDMAAASCWNTNPDYNRWFKFQATSPEVTVTVKRGGTFGTIRRINAAIWESDGLTEVACNRYVDTYDDVAVGFTNLIVGDWYYISVDNNYAGYRGTFTLCIDDEADYDYYEGAMEVSHTADWCSNDAEFTTVGATPDKNPASCWNTNPNYNRWFKFQATTPFVTMTVKRGGTFGTIRRINAAVWESDGLTEVACNRYVDTYDNVVVGFTNLIVGDWYYISVDNNYSGYRGSFTLCMDNTADYDYYEGAIEVSHTTDWCSNDAEFTTVGATPDKNPASCWNTNPNYNRWFKFQATTPFVTMTVKRGGTFGTIRRINAAIWESDGLTEVACNRYVDTYDNVVVGFINLTVGDWYYISVDNNYSGYRGSFTLCMDNTADYDYYEGAIEVSHTADWCSNDAEFTTVGATPDKNPASCWNTNPNYNRWFKFQATTPFVTMTVKRGGTFGTIRRINAAIWESDGLTEVACNRYVDTYDNVVVGFTNLTPGDWYYISVDNNYSGYRGSFTLCMDNTADYDFYEGAIEVPHSEDWCSADAEFTTIGATPDKNPASCWNTNPFFNRWFKFQATTPFVTLTVKRGGTFGTIRRINAAIWESDGLTEVACNRYVDTYDNVVVGFINLTVGDWYYISIDNNYSGYRGTFTLCLDNEADYDFYEGALELTDLSNWCSTPAIYTTSGASSDQNAASCWNTNPNYNRWFKFQAPLTGNLSITVLRGGVYGTIRRINLALWESDGTTEVACDRYAGDYDNVTIQVSGLTYGDWYYISVDNDYSGYRGSFTLCLDDGRMRWNGNMSTDWADPGNWSYAYVPTSYDDVLIPSGLTNYPEVLADTVPTAEANSIIMEPGTRLTVPTGKTLTVFNDFELEADEFEMASLIDNGTLTYDPAKTSYECYLSEDQWHLVSAPLANAKSDVFTSIYLKYFTEIDSSWTYITSLNQNLTPGQGFSAWAASWITGSTTVSYNGTFNTGDQTPPAITYNSGPEMGDGWNLIGNPFPSAIEWNTNWTSNNIDNTIYVYDGTSGQYLAWNRATGLGTMPNGDIPPAQGFWVKANGSTASLTIPHSERKHSSQGFYKGNTDDVLKMYVKGNQYSDQLLIHFNESATEGFDSEFDGYKLMGIEAAPQIYSEMASEKLTLNSLPAKTEMIIPVGLEVGVDGDYKFIFEVPEWLKKNSNIYLEDLQKGGAIDLNVESEYTFIAAPDDDSKRFILNVVMNELDPSISLKSTNTEDIHVYAQNKVLYVSLPEDVNGEIHVYDIMGQLVAKAQGVGNSLNSIPVKANSGIYIVKIVDNDIIFSEKVFLK